VPGSKENQLLNLNYAIIISNYKGEREYIDSYVTFFGKIC